MQFAKTSTNCWLSRDEHYLIRETCGRYYVYEGKRYVGSRGDFDMAQELAIKDSRR